MAGRSQGRWREASKTDSEQARAVRGAGARSTARAASRLYLEIFCHPARAVRADRSSPARSRTRDLVARLGAEQKRICAVLERRNAVICRDRSARAAHRRRCGADPLCRRERAPRPARLRRSDRQDAGAARQRRCRLGALQARSRHRSRADRRGAGHQQQAMGDRPPAGGGIHRRQGRARAAPAPFSRSATRSSRSFRSRTPRPSNSPPCSGISRSAHENARLAFVFRKFEHSFRSGESVLAAVDEVFKPPDIAASVTSDTGGFPPHIALPRRAAGRGRNLGAEKSRTNAARSKAGTRRSTP